MAANVPMPASIFAAWRALPRLLRWTVYLLVALAMGLAAFYGLQRSEVRFEVLYSHLSERQGGEVLQALDHLAIPYRVAGADILIPADDLNTVRMRLAAEGLPRREEAARTAVLPWLMEPRWRQQLDYQHSLEHRVEQALLGLAYLKTAQVHLTLPPASPFLRQPATPPSAAVVVQFNSEPPEEAQIEALRDLVAASVPELSADHVSVLERNGEVLALGQGAAVAGMNGQDMRLNRRLQQLLLPWLGNEYVKTQVTAAAPVSGDMTSAHVSALVMVDAAAYPHWSAADDARVRTLAAQALGDAAAVQVVVLPFHARAAVPATPLPAAPAPSAPPVRSSMGPMAVLGAVLGAALLLLAAWPRRKPGRSDAQENFDVLLARVRTLAAEEPDRAACVLRKWLETTGGADKVATLLLALGEDSAALMLRRLAPSQVTEVAAKLRARRPLMREELRPLLAEFGTEAACQTGLGVEPEAFLGRALTQALGAETAARLLQRQHRELGGFKQLGWLAPEDVAGLLADEPAPVLATVLAHLDREQAARVLALLPAERQEATLLALTRGQSLDAEALGELDAWLRERLAEGESNEQDSGEQLAGDLLVRLPAPVGRRLVEGLAQKSPQLARNLEAEVLQFADLARLDPQSRVNFFKSVPARSLLLALKGADPGLAEALTSGMADTAARRLKDDLTSLGPVKVADIQQAQAEVLGLLRVQVGAGSVLLKTMEAEA